MSYSTKYIADVKARISECVDYLLTFDCGKIEINFNRAKKIIEIVPQPHIKLKMDIQE